MKIFNLKSFETLPDAVLLDTDNTLYLYETAHNFALNAVKEKFINTFSVSPKEFNSTFKMARNEIHQRLKGKGSSHSRLLYMQRMLEILGLGSQVLMALDFEQTYWRSFLSKAILFDDSKEFLEILRAYRIPVAIVTDLTAQIQFRKMVYFGLENHFDYIVTSEEADFDKPNEAPFKLAIDKMGAANKNIWMIGDSIENDVAGAKESINAVTLHKANSPRSIYNDVVPDASFHKFKDLINLLKKIKNK